MLLGGLIGAAAVPFLLMNISTTLGPVSYTHLDVYKRQLQSIGMTGKQLKSMLACEGLYYAIGTILASAFFGTLLSLIHI